jgi:hypothetical protein
MNYTPIKKKGLYLALPAILVIVYSFGLTYEAMTQANMDAGVVLQYANGSIQPYNLATREFGQRLNYTFFTTQFSSFQNAIFGIQTPTGFEFITENAEIIRHNFNTQRSEVIYQGHNLYNFTLLPDGERIVVVFAPHEIHLQTDLRSYSPRLLCLLIIEEQQCREIDLPIDQYRVMWSDSERLLVHGWLENDWFSVDLDMLTPEPFPVQVAVSVTADFDPTADELFVVQETGQIFGYINTTTGRFRRYEFNIDLLESPATVGAMKFSPNRQYLLFQYGYTHHILEMASGEIIANLDDLQNPEWLSDNQIIARYFARSGFFPQELVLLDVEGNVTESIASFEEEVWVKVPS